MSMYRRRGAGDEPRGRPMRRPAIAKAANSGCAPAPGEEVLFRRAVALLQQTPPRQHRLCLLERVQEDQQVAQPRVWRVVVLAHRADGDRIAVEVGAEGLAVDWAHAREVHAESHRIVLKRVHEPSPELALVV